MIPGFFFTVAASITASPLERFAGIASSFGPPGPLTIPPLARLTASAAFAFLGTAILTAE